MKKAILSLGFALMSMVIYAQDMHGKATYQTKRTTDFDLQTTGMDEAQKQMIQARLKKQFEKTYYLDFNRNESVYKQEAELESPNTNSGGMRMVMFGGPGNDGELYKNTQTKEFVNEQNLIGKPFLIADELTAFDWKISKETKNIGKYECFKATAALDEERTVTAWYTPAIPVNQGPAEYWGLPGLIIELEADDLQYLCTEITISQSSENIKKPTTGKVVSQAEFDELQEKKMQEMEASRGRESRHGDGSGRVRVRIGG